MKKEKSLKNIDILKKHRKLFNKYMLMPRDTYLSQISLCNEKGFEDYIIENCCTDDYGLTNYNYKNCDDKKCEDCWNQASI